MRLINDAAHPMSGTARSLGNRILSKLAKHYPAVKEGWTVTIKEDHGIVQITNALLSGRMGCIMHMTKIDPELKAIVRTGGQLLERYNVLRNRSITDVHKALENTKFGNTGQMIAEK